MPLGLAPAPISPHSKTIIDTNPNCTWEGRVYPAFRLTELLLILALAAWSSFWTALGLWFSAKNGHKAWFIFFLLIHLVGIPEIAYLRMRRCWPFKP